MIRLIAVAAHVAPTPLHQPDGMTTQVAYRCGPEGSIIALVIAFDRSEPSLDLNQNSKRRRLYKLRGRCHCPD
jgi:hypothetical protein